MDFTLNGFLHVLLEPEVFANDRRWSLIAWRNQRSCMMLCYEWNVIRYEPGYCPCGHNEWPESHQSCFYIYIVCTYLFCCLLKPVKIIRWKRNISRWKPWRIELGILIIVSRTDLESSKIKKHWLNIWFKHCSWHLCSHGGQKAEICQSQFPVLIDIQLFSKWHLLICNRSPNQLE